MLNAFRHHGLYRFGRRSSGSKLPASAQRLSASRIISGTKPADGPVHLPECSTPFGITDYIGRSRPAYSMRSESGAQRLSASRIISALCPAGGRPDRHVLNAFRHHGLYRVQGRVEWTEAGLGAQRLSASRIISEWQEAMRALGDSISAQRLSASRIISEWQEAMRALGDSISAQRLSASRIISEWQEPMRALGDSISAQRLSASRIISADPRGDEFLDLTLCSTPFGITDYIGRRRAGAGGRGDGVLNAFRHHGLYRPPARDELDVADMCSTPFGITDYIGDGVSGNGDTSIVLNAFRHHGLYRARAPGPRRSRRGCIVLNAFRHHGLYRVLFWRVSNNSAQKCSTPFGITDYIGGGARSGGGGQRADVLNAFRHHGLYRRRTAGGAGRRAGGVLNAFRHHGLYRRRGCGCRSTSPRSAQRLSASRIISVHLVNCFLQTDKWSQKHGSLGLL